MRCVSGIEHLNHGLRIWRFMPGFFFKMFNPGFLLLQTNHGRITHPKIHNRFPQPMFSPPAVCILEILLKPPFFVFNSKSPPKKNNPHLLRPLNGFPHDFRHSGRVKAQWHQYSSRGHWGDNGGLLMILRVRGSGVFWVAKTPHAVFFGKNRGGNVLLWAWWQVKDI